MPKLALPILYHASLEDDERLHGLWARLLVTALNPNSSKPRTAFVDIIRQLEPVDAQILDVIYRDCLESKEQQKEYKRKEVSLPFKLKKSISKEDVKQSEIEEALGRSDTRIDSGTPLAFQCHQSFVMLSLEIDFFTYTNAIDNLMRQQLITPYLRYQRIPGTEDRLSYDDGISFPVSQGYDAICMTELGITFIEACIIDDTISWR